MYTMPENDNKHSRKERWIATRISNQGFANCFSTFCLSFDVIAREVGHCYLDWRLFLYRRLIKVGIFFYEIPLETKQKKSCFIIFHEVMITWQESFKVSDIVFWYNTFITCKIFNTG